MRSGFPFRGKWSLGFLAVLVPLLMLSGCAPRRTVSLPQEPAAPPRVSGGVPAASAQETVDASLIQKEIQRRQNAVGTARNSRTGMSGSRTAILDAWILAVEDQIARLRGIQDDMKAWPPSADPSEKARRSQQIAARLLGCLALAPLEPPAPSGPRMTEETRVSWDPVRSAYGKGDCGWVIREHEAMTKAHPEAVVPTDVEAMRGVCLGRGGRRQEAIRALDPLLQGQAQVVDAQQLQYLTANWLFEEGQLDRAGERYQALLDGNKERDRWAELARLRLEQIRLRRAETPPSVPPERVPEPAPVPQTGVAPPQVTIERPPLPGARPTASEMPDKPAEPAPGQPPAVSPPSTSGTTAMIAPPQEPPSGQRPAEQPGQEGQSARLQEAQRLLDNDRYEEAIEAFQKVEGPEQSAQARKGIQEAQDRYAEKRRREAAALVLKAREEGGANRKANLVKALEILQDANKRYPNNRYAPKIDQNIQDVVGQVRAIDPSFRP